MSPIPPPSHGRAFSTLIRSQLDRIVADQQLVFLGHNIDRCNIRLGSPDDRRNSRRRADMDCWHPHYSNHYFRSVPLTLFSM